MNLTILVAISLYWNGVTAHPSEMRDVRAFDSYLACMVAKKALEEGIGSNGIMSVYTCIQGDEFDKLNYSDWEMRPHGSFRTPEERKANP